MPSYLAPGVYVEEVSFSAPTIEGVGTTTTGFAGPTLTGPIGGVQYAGGTVVAGAPAGGTPQLLTSFGDFQNIYGGYGNLSFSTTNAVLNTNYMAMAVKAFFDNGGSMLYVSRVYAPPTGGTNPNPGFASATVSNVVVTARFPGAYLTGQAVTVTLIAAKVQKVSNLPPGSLLGEPGAGGAGPTLFANSNTGAFMSNAATPAALPAALPQNLYLLTLQVTAPGANGAQMVYSNLGLDINHPNYIGNVLGIVPPRPIDALQNQICFELTSALQAGAPALFTALFAAWPDPAANPNAPAPAVTFTLSGGSDGAVPTSSNYDAALKLFEPLEDIAIVGAPGSSIYNSNIADISVINSLITHVEKPRAYRVAILETWPGLLASDIENVRAQIDSTYSALYVPWVVTPNPLAVSGTSTPARITVPPTGFMAGIYARSDNENSVAKAPANEVVLGAVDFERHISFAEQGTLNPLGINCLRFFPDRGYLVWGARTATSNTELMYINVRRYLIYLEHSIDNGTQWAVFENNGPSLWARVTDSIDSFLNNEFAEGNLLGTKPSDAYFVRCDRTTMTQNDLDNGRLICLIGVALLKPAEFVIFRIGQMTANAPS